MAGPKPAVTVEGARELRAALRRMDDRLVRQMRDVNADAAEPVAEEARRLVPILTGALEADIRVSKGARSAAVLAGRRLVPYAGPIHFGWPARNIEPQPFLYDALDARREEVADRYRRAVDALVVQLDRETPG